MLITPEYLLEQQILHQHPRGYGTKGRKWAYFAESLMTGYGCASVLDYGCGQGSMLVALLASMADLEDAQGYDPAVHAFADEPRPADLVICTDVLEHVEPDLVAAVVADLRRCTQKVLFLVIGTAPTAKTLSDGRQAHISLHGRAWWAQALSEHFHQVEEHAIKPEKQWVAVFTPRSADT